ncbi:MAG: MBL fold metallo-hydrolase [Dehalococcoidia bacterium]
MPTIELVLMGYGVRSSQGGLGYSTVALVRGRNTILFDTAHYGRRNLLEQALQQRGVQPEEVNMVVVSHAHWDHCQNVDAFPAAEMVVHPVELDYSRSPRKGDWATPSYFVESLKGHKIREASEGEELEPGVRVLETPGHTKGHISLAVDTPDGTVVLAADAFTNADTVRTGQIGIVFWDEAQSEESVQKLLGTGRIIYPGHDRPFRILEDKRTEYLVEQQPIELYGALEPGKGVVSVTLGPHAPVERLVHPEARKR